MLYEVGYSSLVFYVIMEKILEVLVWKFDQLTFVMKKLTALF